MNQKFASVAVVLSLFFTCLVAEAAGERTFRPERYALGDTGVRRLQPIDSASWIWAEGLKAEITPAPPRFLRFRRRFLSPGGTARLDVSADERFVLFVDGRMIGRGPDRGDVSHWMYHTYDIEFPEGEHCVEAVVWRIGENAPLAQFSYRGGFILKADGAFDTLLTTGTADWEAGELKGTEPDWNLPRAGVWGAGAPFRVTGTGFLDERPATWRKTVVVHGPVRPAESTKYGFGARADGWRLFPTQLEEQTEDKQSPGRFIQPGVIPGSFAPHTKTEVLWDLGDYFTAYPYLVTSGGRGAKIRWGWAEAMRRGKNGFKTDNRADCKDATFDGFTDEFISDGRTNAVFTTPWFRCGRWVKFTVETADEPLEILDNEIIESRYPLADTSVFSCDDPTFSGVRRICRRAMQMCAHEMLFDCPFYEQQMYPGDTRVQLDVLTAMDADDRLIRRVIDIFDFARRPDGMIPMNYPTRGHQESATYTMCEIMMFGDYVRHHANRAWLKARLPGMRAALDAVAACANEEGLLVSLPGWSFMDWVPAWTQGVAPDGEGATPSAVNNLYWALTLVNAAYVERACGEESRAALWEALAKKVFAAVERRFWDAKRGLYADTVRHDRFSEHAQCLALLSELVPADRRAALFEKLVSAPDLARCTVYFSYYLFDVYFRFGRGDLFLKRLDLWRDYVRRDLKTTMERPDDGENGSFEARSDCHAWGAHPLVWMQRGLAGVESAAPFFEKVRVRPCPGSLRRIQSRTPHPKGFVETNLRFADGDVSGEVRLPPGVTGVFVWKDVEYPLAAGANDVDRLLHPTKPPRGEPPVLTPAFEPGMTDHTAAIQTALDAVAKAGGGTVRIPPGEYKVSSLSIGNNTRLELAGGVTDATAGYTDELRRRSADPSVSTIVRPTGKGFIWIFLYNFPLPATVDDGASGITVSGGVFDCDAQAKFLAFAPGRDIRIENVLVKDLMNDHAIQLDGCENAVVTNCVFAGMDFDANVKGKNCVIRETIQMEHTGPAALYPPSGSPLACDKEDNRPCRDVTVAGCWFGPSERFGAQLIPIGHHTPKRSCEGLRILGNVFVDPRYCSLRIANYTDGVVAGNRFVYTHDVKPLRPDAAIVTFWGQCRLRKDEKGFVFTDNAFELPAGFSLPRSFLAPGRRREVVVDPVVTVTLTFDDGSRDHLKAAALLEKYGWRGCFNIITDKVGDGRHLTWDEIRDLKRRGHEIASHTASHPSLKKLLADGKRAEALDELVRSRDAITKGTGSAPRFLCHPYIAWNDEVDALIREAGMTPYGHVRYNHGKGTKAGTPTGVGAYLDRKRVEGKLKVDLLFHGVESGGGWNPIDSIDDFEAALKEIKAREAAGAVRVLPYGEFAGADAPSAETVGRQIVRQFLSTDPTAYNARGFTGEVHNGTYVPYAVVSLWVNALEFARKIGDRELERTLLARVEPFLPGGARADRATKARHVDFSVFGALPLEKYILDGDKTARTMGLRYADRQWEPPQPGDLDDFPKFLKGHFVPVERQLAYLKDGYSGETRLWIDDMYMINLLQTQAYRATKDRRYIDRAAKEMCLYLDRLQQPNGLFHHAQGVPFVWSRGDGWMAAGMPMILQFLPKDDPLRPRILDGYRRMMATLRVHQREDGLWTQLVDDPESWPETSGTAMFAYAYLVGVRCGWLDRDTYLPRALKAWRALARRRDARGNLHDVCIGTGARNDRNYYLERGRITGDPHGHAAMLWTANELLLLGREAK